MVNDNSVLPNPIQEYFSDNADGKFMDLFEANEDNVDLRTHLNANEVVIVNELKMFSQFLEGKNITSLYTQFMYHYLRFKVSYERKSRSEFVDIHRKDRFEQNLKTFGDFSNVMKSKE